MGGGLALSPASICPCVLTCPPHARPSPRGLASGCVEIEPARANTVIVICDVLRRCLVTQGWNIPVVWVHGPHAE